MQSFTITRVSGEKCGPGEFHVEDSDGVEWQATAIPSKKYPGKLVCLNEVICMNRNYECNWELRGDIQDRTIEFIEAEQCGTDAPNTET